MSDLSLEALKVLLNKKGSISLKASGNSMAPVICDGDELDVYSFPFEQIQEGDVIAGYFKGINTVVAHRVIKKELIRGKIHLYLKGDHNDFIDSRTVGINDYIGKVMKSLQKDDIHKLDEEIFYIKKYGCVISGIDCENNIPESVLPRAINNEAHAFHRELTTELIILLSYRCNLRCLYCSNDSGSNTRNGIRADIENIEKAILFVIRNALLLRKISNMQKKKPARILISGGGEPTLEWDLVEAIVGIVAKEKEKYGEDIAELVILTNAQFDKEKADYLIDNFDDISVSYDGISAQDHQRPRADGNSSEAFIKYFLDTLEERGKSFSIRMTVTGDKKSNLERDVTYLFEKYRNLLSIVAEPLVQIGRGKNGEVMGVDYTAFVNQFNRLADRYYQRFFNSATLLNQTFGYPCQRLCGISLVLSPFNVITCCDTVTPDDRYWNEMQMGDFDEKGIKIKQQYNLSVSDQCDDCWAKDFCEGGCVMHVSTLSEDEKTAFCKYMKEMIKCELLRRLNFSKKCITFEYKGKACKMYCLPWRRL